MNIQILRYAYGPDDTLSRVIVDGSFLCYALEDKYRTEKVYGETSIPHGNYQIALRKTGGMNKRYAKRFGALHDGMLWLKEVPNFKYVLIHCGNRADDTAGCLLVGDSVNNNKVEEGFLGHSAQAYRRLYSMILQKVKEGTVSLTITSL